MSKARIKQEKIKQRDFFNPILKKIRDNDMRKNIKAIYSFNKNHRFIYTILACVFLQNMLYIRKANLIRENLSFIESANLYNYNRWRNARYKTFINNFKVGSRKLKRKRKKKVRNWYNIYIKAHARNFYITLFHVATKRTLLKLSVGLLGAKKRAKKRIYFLKKAIRILFKFLKFLRRKIIKRFLRKLRIKNKIFTEKLINKNKLAPKTFNKNIKIMACSKKKSYWYRL